MSIDNNMYNDKNERSSLKVCSLLTESGISLTDDGLERIGDYLALIREWNDYASLVSVGDLDSLWESHAVDSLSLGPLLQAHRAQGGECVDIGSGGGFPAIPLSLILPQWHFSLIDRRQRKVGFLENVKARLGLENVTIHHGEFPRAPMPAKVDAWTARAVERPQDLTREILRRLTPGAVFLCQSGADVEGMAVDKFHVEPIHDAWAAAGLRRGSLSLIRRKKGLGKEE